MPHPGLQAISDEHPTAPPPRPARSGQPWADDDYEKMVDAVKEGEQLGAIAAALQRPNSTILSRLRRLLPVQERRCLGDRVLTAARAHLQDPAYDWKQTMLLSEEPRTVQPPPPIVRHGVEGLTDADLVTVAYSMLCAHRGSETRLLREVSDEVEGRGVVHHLVRRRVDHLLHGNDGAGIMLLRSDVERTAWEWVNDAPGWQPARTADQWDRAPVGAHPDGW